MKNKFTYLIAAAFLAGSCASLAAKTPTHHHHMRTHHVAAAEQITMSEYGQMEKLLAATRYAHGLAVVASPFMGERDIYDIDSLIVNLPSLHTDLHLLKQRQKLEDYAKRHCEKMIWDRPLIDLSGSLEAQAFYNTHDFSSWKHHSLMDIDLTRAELDAVAEVGHWITGALLFDYENKRIEDFGPRVANSRIKLDRGFITVGNLNRSPFYFTIGQVFAPFGSYSTVRVSDPLPKLLGRTKARAAVLSYYNTYGINSIRAAIYGFRGDSYVHNKRTIDQGGFDVDYMTKLAGGSDLKVGGGFIVNIADSQFLQDMLFGDDEEHLAHRVPAINLHGALDIDRVRLTAEYVGAIRHFAKYDVEFDCKNRGAKPQAISLEASYKFDAVDQFWNVGIGYDRSWETREFKMPKDSYFAVLNTSIWKYTIESLEFRHNDRFRRFCCENNYVVGQHEEEEHPFTKSQNIITLQIGVYF